jgi:hypothetical protein
MDSKKGQGISLNFIVIAIIAALVLVVIIAFTVGGLGSTLSKIFEAGDTSTEDANIDVVKATCNKLCDDARKINEPSEWESVSYCNKKFTFGEEQASCWEQPINVQCSTAGQDVYDNSWKCNQDSCGLVGGCKDFSCSGTTTEKDTLTDAVIVCSDMATFSSCDKVVGCSWEQ